MAFPHKDKLCTNVSQKPIMSPPSLSLIFTKTKLFLCHSHGKGSWAPHPQCSIPGTEALEASGCENIKVAGLEAVGPRQLSHPFRRWDVHLGRLGRCWLLRPSGGLCAHHFHWRRLLSSSVGLDGKASCRSKPQSRRSQYLPAATSIRGQTPATLPSLVKRVPYLTQTSGAILVQRGSIYRSSFCLYPHFQNPWC